MVENVGHKYLNRHRNIEHKHDKLNYIICKTQRHNLFIKCEVDCATIQCCTSKQSTHPMPLNVN